MKRRLFSMVLVSALALSSLTACGKKYEAKLPTAEESAEIYVQQIEDLQEDFIKGMDISSVIAEEESGVKYYNEQGEEEDLFKILADSGVNYIRVRVWNNPYDEDGNGYGGGNNDVKKAAEIGKRAAKYGMKLLVDFHYSDFWADPNKQYTPVVWRGMSDDTKASALYDFTVESLNTIIKAGADVGMVQIGNEINNGLASEYSVSGIMQLLDSASKAVRQVSDSKKKDIKIAVHYTEIDNFDDTLQKAQDLEDNNIDYDVFGVSYYPFWHGTMENMTNVLNSITEKYGKETCVLETSYCYTAEDGDGFGNSVSAEDCLEDYPVSVQGQANCIRDVMAAANDAGALGVFYWEGAWVPVGSDATTNTKIWQEHGSGWASSYSASYDEKDAGLYYGGCSWDNQAMFDFEGKKLPSLDVFKYVNYGATCETQVLAYRDVYVESGLHDEIVMPETVEAIYNNPTITEGVEVTWNQEQIDEINVDEVGEYEIEGITSDDSTIVAKVKITNVNLVKNPSFEDEDSTMWGCEYLDGNNCTDIQDKAADAVSGTKAYHFYNGTAFEFYVEQNLGKLKNGKYNFKANMQGGDVGASAEIYAYVKIIKDGKESQINSQPVTLDGWCNWKTPTINDIELDGESEVVVGFYVKSGAKGWGTVDDVEFFSQQ